MSMENETYLEEDGFYMSNKNAITSCMRCRHYGWFSYPGQGDKWGCINYRKRVEANDPACISFEPPGPEDDGF